MKKRTGVKKTMFKRRSTLPAAMYAHARTGATALKSVDALSTGSVGSTTAPAVLVVPKLGSAFFNRLSNRTRAVSLQLTGDIIPTFSNAAALVENYMRIVIYYDRRPNGANPSQSDLILDTDATGAATTTVRSGININNRDRFVILRDRKVLLPKIGINGAAADPTTSVQCLNDQGKGGFAYIEFIKLRGLETIYNSNGAGTVADISAGAFGLLVFNQDASGSPAWNFTLTARFKFLD